MPAPDPDRRRTIAVGVAAVGIGFALGRGLDWGAVRTLGIAGGLLSIGLAMAGLAAGSAVLLLARPRSGVPTGLLVIACLLGAGPVGLYHVLPAVVVTTPVALFFALRQKDRNGGEEPRRSIGVERR